jgi:putative ABC transport system substrate-binding protein
MHRRRFLLASLATAAVPGAVVAQPAGRPARIGVLAATELTEVTQAAIRDGLREHGYVEGRNIVIEWRAAEGRDDRAAALAAEMVQLKVEVIVALLGAVDAAKNATSTIPIVMAPAGDPVGRGFVVSLGRPGRNITGVTGIADELAGKQLETLRQLVPRFTRLALLIGGASFDSFAQSLVAQTQAAATTSGITLRVVREDDAGELERAFATMAAHRDQAVLVQNRFTPWFGRIAQLGLRLRLPSICAAREFAEAGGLLAYGASLIGLTRRAMFYVARILGGARPADLPVEQPTRFELVINLRTAKALGLTVPASLLAQADRLIE